MDIDYLYQNQEVLLHHKYPEEILRQAQELITPRTSYVAEWMAVDADGKPIRPTSDAAVRWNVEGALAKVSNPYGVIPPGIIRFLDEYVAWYLKRLRELEPASLLAQSDPQRFASFGDFCAYASHDYVLRFLGEARQYILEDRHGRR